jgi:hypothetical protein
VIEQLQELPQVRSVALTDRVPMSGTTSGPIETDDTRGKHFSSWSLEARVAPAYFETLGIPLLNGRNFSPLEIERSSPVAIVSGLAARQMWPDENPIGRRFKVQSFLGRNQTRWDEAEVVGVARSVRSANLSRLDPIMVYLPLPPASLENILVRLQDEKGRSDRKNALASMRATLASIDKNIPASLLLVSLEDGPLHFERVQANIWAISALSLAALALVLATVGIYGVMSYLVSQQTREIGILMALGASAPDVLRSVILAGLRPVFIGAILGLAGAAAVTGILRAGTALFVSSGDPLFGLSMFDPLTFVGLSGLLAVIAILASALPAWRALRVDPIVALRYE